MNAFRLFASPLFRQMLHVIFVADASRDALTAGLSDAIVLVIVRLVGRRSVLRASFEDGLVRSLSIVSSVITVGCSLDSEARVTVLHN